MQDYPARVAIVILTLCALRSAPATFVSNAAEQTSTEHRLPREYQEHALRNEGNSERGSLIFNSERTACFQCHSTDGKGGKAGPDLYASGDKYSRADLIRSVLEPSATIMMGYSTTVIETTAGQKIQGVLKAVSDTELVLAGVGNVTQRVARASIKTQSTSPVSLMPEGLQAALSLEEFTDLIAHLERLKQPEMQLANAAGTPAVIQRLSRPVAVQPFHSESNRFDHPVWFAEHPTLNGHFVVAEQITAKLWLLEKRRDGESKTLLISVLPNTKKVAGVRCAVVREMEWTDGEIAEISWNYFAICPRCNDVFYFGEDVDIYEDGEVASHEGAWRAGQNGAQPGLIMPGRPLNGARYYQEIAPGVALDRAEHLDDKATVETPAGMFENCLSVAETSPLEPGHVSLKHYARGVGLLHDGALKLVERGSDRREGSLNEDGQGGDDD
jgi:putative heme-binding domain-containing protein